MKANQEEITGFFTEYANQENEEIDEELDKLAAEIESEALPEASKSKYYLKFFYFLLI